MGSSICIGYILNDCVVAGDAASSGAGPSGTSEQDAQDQGLVDRIAHRSDPLWVALSQCIGRIEAGLKTPGGAGDTPAASRVLPPGAAQVIFVMSMRVCVTAASGLIWPHVQCSKNSI